MTRSDIVREIMNKKNLKVSDVAREAELPYTSVKSILERGIEKASYINICKICHALGITPDGLEGLIKETISDNYQFSKEELSIIEKYHALDEPGKKHIDYELDRETQRVQAITQKDTTITSLRQQLNAQPSLPLALEAVPHTYYISYYQHMASAGNGEYLFNDIPTDLICVPDTPMARQADFVLGVSGDSMEPTFHNGDKVFVEKTDIVQIGEIGIFFIGNECYIKETGPDGLISHNPKYKMIPGTENIRCVGRVLGKTEN